MTPTLTRDDDEMLKLPEVGRWIGVSKTQVYRLIRGERPLPVRQMGKVKRVRLGDLRKWIQQTPEVGL